MQPHDPPSATDVLVVGAGPGGYVAAIRAAQSGFDVTLVERDAYGGTCLTVGCIPSKALITATDLAHRAGNATGMGIRAEVDVDFGAMLDWKDGVVTRLTGGVEKLCRANGVTLVDGTASFTSETAVRVEGPQVEATVEFEHAIVATGSRPVELPGFAFDGEHVLSSTHALGLPSLPDRLVIVGAGYIGMELSTVFAKLGVDVTVVEMLDQVLPGYERDIARVVEKRADALGVDVSFGETADDWTKTPRGVRLTTDADGDPVAYHADHVVVAVGREPVTDTLDPATAGLDPDERGFVPTDDRTRTSTDGIYAIGDVAGEPLLAHKASREGEIAADAIAGRQSTLDPAAIPAAVFTDPEVCTVGLTEAEAEEAGREPVVGRMPLRASGRALTLGETDGFVRIVADGTTEAVLAHTVHTHPTLTEAVREAAASARGEAVHTRNS
jgi:dihydrolipoamide dehydrogenase